MHPAPALVWTRVGDRYQATATDGTVWSLEQHAPTPERAGTPPTWTPRWWLHQYAEGEVALQDTHQTCQLVTKARWTALHRHPEVLRYAEVLAEGWTPSHHEDGALLMRRGDHTAPLADLTRTPEPATG